MFLPLDHRLSLWWRSILSTRTTCMFHMRSGLLRTTASRRPRKVSQALPLVLADSVFSLLRIFAAYSASAADYNYTSTLLYRKKEDSVWELRKSSSVYCWRKKCELFYAALIIFLVIIHHCGLADYNWQRETLYKP